MGRFLTRSVLLLSRFVLGTSAVLLHGQPTRSAPPQIIRIEPVDAAHVRLHLEGRENWDIESAAFTLVPTLEGPPGGAIRVVAAQGDNKVSVPGAATRAQTFELSVSPSGLLHFKEH
jgi:hypothetical protein